MIQTNTQTQIETGDKVTWVVGEFTFFGIFKRIKDNNTSLVQVYQRNFQKFFVGEMEVTSHLLCLISNSKNTIYTSIL